MTPGPVSPRRALLTELKKRDGRATAGELLDAVLVEHDARMTDVLEALSLLIEDGTLYRPSPDTGDLARVSSGQTVAMEGDR